MLSVHLTFAAVLTRCVGVQVTVIVLQIKCATQLTTSATLVVCHKSKVAQQIMGMMSMLAVHLACAAVLTRSVDVQVTVIVLQVKVASLTTMNAQHHIIFLLLSVI